MERYLPRTIIAERIGAVLLGGVFLVNVYVGLFDSTLSQYQPLHYYLNWLIAAVTLAAAAILFAKPKNLALSSLAGIVWPVAYLASLAVNVESRLCLGTNVGCFDSVGSAYQYLILNNSSAGWKLFSFTIPLAIALLVLTIGFSSFGVYRSMSTTMKKEASSRGVQEKYYNNKASAPDVPLSTDGERSWASKKKEVR